MLDSGSKGEKIFIFIVIIICILGGGAIAYDIYGNVFKDPIVGDWNHRVNLDTGLTYSFDDDGTYTIYITDGDGSNKSFYTSGTWTRVNDNYYKAYDKNGKLDTYLNLDNGWIYDSGGLAFKKQ